MNVYALTVRDEAQEETEAIRTWYEAKRPGLGDRFVDALEAAYKQIQENPFLQIRKSTYRYAQIKGFPYFRIVYVVDQQVITVYQVRHTSRDVHPKFGP